MSSKKKTSLGSKFISLTNDELSAKKFYFLYTVIFLLTAAAVFSQFIYNHKSFVFCDTNGGGDGLVQHYNGFVYFGKYLRRIIRVLLREHQLIIPTWDLNIGYGQDILTTLNFYVIGEPLNLLSALVPTKYSEAAYTFLIVLRLYLAGITFSLFCRYRGHRTAATLTGAMVYVFSQYSILIGTLHPFFLMPIVMFPCVCLGIEMVLNEQKHFIFIISTFVFTISSFYMLYMMVILCVLFAVLRYIDLHRDRRIEIRELLRTVAVFFVDGILAVGLGAFLFIPSAMAILITPRANVENYVPILYEIKYYINLFPAFLTGGGDYYCQLGYTAFGLIAVIAAAITMRKRKENRLLLSVFLILLIILCIPFCGHIMNGGGYVTNRWIWAMSFWVAYMIVSTLPIIREFTASEWKKLTIIAISYAFFVMLFFANRTEKYMATMAMLLTVIFITYLVAAKRKHLFNLTAALLALILLAQNNYYVFHPGENSRLNCYTNAGTAFELLVDKAPTKLLTDTDVGYHSVYRYDSATISTGDLKRNVSMLINIPGVPFYFSTISGSVSEFNHSMGMNYTMESTYETLDRRAMLDALLAVKTFIIPKGKEQYLPYGYDSLVAENNRYSAYSSEITFPFAFISDKMISKNSYSDLDEVKKQEALMQAIVLEDIENDAEVSFLDEEIFPEFEASKGVEIDGNRIIVKDTSAVLTLKTGEVIDSELYVEVKGLDYSGISPFELKSLDGMAIIDKNNFKRNNRFWTEPNAFAITMTCADESTKLIHRTYKNAYYSGYHDYLCNLGYAATARENIKLTFNAVGIYTFESLRVIKQPMHEMKTWVNATCDQEISHITLGPNEIKGKYDAERSGVAFFSIPYSDGWKAYVDGEEAQLVKANVSFVGVLVPSGSHEIQLKYHTPYLHVGFLCSGVSIFILVVWMYMNIKRRKTRCQNDTISSCSLL